MNAAPPLSFSRFLAWTAAALVLLLLWDASALDLPLARGFGNAQGFALTHDWWLQEVLHTGVRQVAWGLMLILVLMIWHPLGPLRVMPRADRVGLVAGILLAALVVQLLKRASLTSCPWDLVEFGGAARHVSHWRWGVADGGGGHCFPAGHASTAFAFLAAYFWLRPWAPRVARWWLAATLLAGLLFGAVQMVRGAHYLSHVLWAGWLCWLAGGLLWLGVQAWRVRQSPPILTPQTKTLS
ncbi:MAG: phosphatase PAP2 family protein [Burkholderiales bacterium]|nr:phosphatase PAP2 family protein [Burkholderiales bacterium]MBK8667580.1 phosphatase PAP2 family protein [Burkholderiales bacterium]